MHNLTWFKGSEYTTHSRKAAVLCMWHVLVDMCGGHVHVLPLFRFDVCVLCKKCYLLHGDIGLGGGGGGGLMCPGLPS